MTFELGVLWRNIPACVIEGPITFVFRKCIDTGEFFYLQGSKMHKKISNFLSA